LVPGPVPERLQFGLQVALIYSQQVARGFVRIFIQAGALQNKQEEENGDGDAPANQAAESERGSWLHCRPNDEAVEYWSPVTMKP
jgi:hypothetical protein